MRIELSKPLPIHDIAEVLNVDAPNSGNMIKFICTDSREARKGDLFVALSNSPLLASKHIDEAVNNGAYTLSAHSNSDIYVDDPYMALLALAKYYRSKLPNLKITVAITGSVGKTTLKEMISHIVSSSYKTHSTSKNYNNFLGVALTLLTAPTDTELLVVELGMNHIGEIEILSDVVQPDICIITNIGYAHIGNLGTRENIAKAKLEILHGNPNAILIAPYGEKLIPNIKNKITVSTVSSCASISVFPVCENADYSIVDIFSQVRSITSQKLNLCGEHYISSLGFAVAVADLLDISDSQLTSSISALTPSLFRKKTYKMNGYVIVDDTYSSSPDAVIEEMKTLSANSATPRSCVLGDMLELGDMSNELHEEIGIAAYKYGFRKIYAFGNFANQISKGAQSAGMPPDDIHVNTSLDYPVITAQAIADNFIEGETILFKGSRITRTERIIEQLEKITNV